MNGRRGKVLILTLLMLMTFLGLQSFAGVWINTIKLTTTHGVTVVPNQSVREDTTIINFGGYDWYVIGTNGINEMTLFATDNWRENTYGSTNAHPTDSNDSWLNTTKYGALTQEEKDLIELQTLDGVADLKFFLLSKAETEAVSMDIRGASVFWWTRTANSGSADGVYSNMFSNAFSTIGCGFHSGVRPAVTIDITGIDIGLDTATARVVNRGNVPNKKAVNVNEIPVSKGTVTIIPNQDVSGSPRQEISFGGITWYAIGSNGKDRVTLLAKDEYAAMGFESPRPGFVNGSNEYFSSDLYNLLQFVGSEPGLLGSVSSVMEPVLLNDTRETDSTTQINGNYVLDTLYQSAKVFLLSKYEVRDLHPSLRVCPTSYGGWWLRSPMRASESYGLFVDRLGSFLQVMSSYVVESVRPAVVVNLTDVTVSSTSSGGVQTISFTL